MSKRIIRVFPRKTNLTPIDCDVRFTTPSLFDSADEVHISVAFTYDLRRAEYLYSQWKYVATTTIGGPATGMRGEEFIPGMYVKSGTVITSRGCNNRCWFCSVWKREGDIRELPINDGWNVLDDNLLSCSPDHIKRVFSMLERQNVPIRFTGGLEARLISETILEMMKQLRIGAAYFAYDTDDDFAPLSRAVEMMKDHGFKFHPKSHVYSCYTLIGWPKDSFEDAEKRLRRVLGLGLVPMAMLWRNKDGNVDPSWKKFQRRWARPSIIMSKKNLVVEEG